jgi:hypothetical protein
VALAIARSGVRGEFVALIESTAREEPMPSGAWARGADAEGGCRGGGRGTVGRGVKRGWLRSES